MQNNQHPIRRCGTISVCGFLISNIVSAVFGFEVVAVEPVVPLPPLSEEKIQSLIQPVPIHTPTNPQGALMPDSDIPIIVVFQKPNGQVKGTWIGGKLGRYSVSKGCYALLRAIRGRALPANLSTRCGGLPIRIAHPSRTNLSVLVKNNRIIQMPTQQKNSMRVAFPPASQPRPISLSVTKNQPNRHYSVALMTPKSALQQDSYDIKQNKTKQNKTQYKKKKPPFILSLEIKNNGKGKISTEIPTQLADNLAASKSLKKNQYKDGKHLHSIDASRVKDSDPLLVLIVDHKNSYTGTWFVDQKKGYTNLLPGCGKQLTRLIGKTLPSDLVKDCGTTQVIRLSFMESSL